MKYFKNTELARLYNVSEKSVRNWIDAARQGKLNLELHENGGKFYITNSSKNTVLVEALVQKGKKYKNSRGFKVVKPTERFYKLYSQKQIYDIIANIDIFREIPLQYCYFDGGAHRWDEYTRNLLKENTENPLTNTITLLGLELPYLDLLLSGYAKVNIVDLGVGNVLPLRKVIDHFLDEGKLNRYIGIDLSNEMLAIARQNVRAWFGDRVNFEGHVRDFSCDRFADLLAADTFTGDGQPIVNLIFFLGGTISNLREPTHALAAIHDSMGKDDLFLFSKKLDTDKSRRHFDATLPGGMAVTMVMDLLNIDSSLYDIEQFFDEKRMAREARAKLKVALSIEFEVNGKHRVIELNKDESILLWRARHQTAVQDAIQFSNNGFEVVQASKSRDQEYLLLTSRLKNYMNY